MASDQIIPNSTKKQQQLEAGKKKLEEFRKKRAKKAASNNSAPSANGDVRETKPTVSDTAQLTDGISDSGSVSHVGKTEQETIDVHEVEPNVNPISSSSRPSSSPVQTYSTDWKLDQNMPSSGVHPENNKALHLPEDNIRSNINHFSNRRQEDALKNNSDDHLNNYNSAIPVITQASVTESSPERSHGSSFPHNLSHAEQQANGPTYRDSSSEARKTIQGMLDNRYTPVFSADDWNNKNLVDRPATESSSSAWSPESISTSFRSEAIPTYNKTSTLPSLAGRRSRPSFLHSIPMSRNSSNSLSDAETDKAHPFGSKVHPMDAPVSSNVQSFMNSSVANVGDDLSRQGMYDFDMSRSNNFNSTKQNEDFAALEQHIEDLTQDKFSLQRALEASRVLAESLATENSALTDTYNQQGSIVNQLKADMEILQNEIKTQLVELEAVRTEYGNAQLECNAADERAKLLASEVIELEEKALRLRSNELKLQRQLENLEAEMSSQKRRISSLEKDLQDRQSTIEALQEEKKLMQSKLLKAPTTRNLVDPKKSPTSRKEASTSTDDLDESEDALPGTTNFATQATVGQSDASSTSLIRNFGLEVSSSSIPSDQMRTIQNINTLISELTLEKEELVQALSTESSLSSKLKSLNKELSQKLEVQTQRLELLTSQSMASDNNSARKSPPRTMLDNTPYADEGDEVVERVLGWVMKLFPGGPSRRQTKHL
uniref:protein BLISTER isoform X2 n=1 Tax=Erigeron canadensis TaxID=72917 RepID=UPI001CB96BA0|nr:protein BLISTER isoform X2 [Erigeron canadensis]